MDRIMRDKWRTGEITEGEYYKYLNSSDSQENIKIANIDELFC